MRPNSRRFAGAAAAAAVLLATVTTATAANAASTSKFTVPHSQPSWATPSRARANLSSTTKVSFSVALSLRNEADAEAVAAAVSDPHSTLYGHYLTPSQFNSRYAPTTGAVAKIKSYLRGQGFKVDSVADGNRWVSATGTAAQIKRAFGATLKTYAYKGKALRAPDRAVQLPSSLHGLVLGVNGLDQGSLLRQPGARSISGQRPAPVNSAAAGKSPKAAKPAPASCSTYWNQHTQTMPSAYGSTTFPTYICGYSPSQIRTAYGVPAGKTGVGTTIAIIDAYGSPTIVNDVNKYSTTMVEPTLKAGQYKEKLFKPYNLQTECGGEAGWNGEETLDVEAVHGMAPGANIYYVGAQNCDTGLDTAINWVIQNHVASIVSNSWGATGEGNLGSSYTTEKSLFLQAKAQGIGFYFSSGDDGDNATYPFNDYSTPQPDYPSSDANVTAVGGTSLAVSSTKGYLWETSWGSHVSTVNFATTPATYPDGTPGDFWGGAGGGASLLTPQPSYQIGVVPDSLSKLHGSAKMRVVPDVSALADPFTGYAVGQTVSGVFGIDAWGGTSLACPLFAAVQALAQQGRVVPIGFANPLLYSIPAGSFHDVVASPTKIAVATPSGSALATFDMDTSLLATPGYDDVTGRGSPVVSKLIGAEFKARGVLPPHPPRPVPYS